MAQYEYKVIPTPSRPRRAKGVKGTPARFAHVLTEAINAEAADGWQFVKTETLPMEAPKGWFGGKEETFQSVIVFKRPIASSDGSEVTFGTDDGAAAAGTLLPATGAVLAADRSMPARVEAAEPLTALDREEPPLTTDEIDLAEADGGLADVEIEDEKAEEETESDAPEDAEETVEFDKDKIDPLRSVVEANRGD